MHNTKILKEQNSGAAELGAHGEHLPIHFYINEYLNFMAFLMKHSVCVQIVNIINCILLLSNVYENYPDKLANVSLIRMTS